MIRLIIREKKTGQRWQVEAKNLQCACDAIAHAVVTGSVGHTDYLCEIDRFGLEKTTLLADVKRIGI